MRPTLDEYLMGIAFAASARSTCPRASVGAVIAKKGKILSTGYNGSISGLPHCIDCGCIMDNGSCIRTIHAEANAILQAAEDLNGCTIYCTHKPCLNCTKLILQAGIIRIVYKNFYNSGATADLLISEKGAKIEKL